MGIWPHGQSSHCMQELTTQPDDLNFVGLGAWLCFYVAVGCTTLKLDSLFSLHGYIIQLLAATTVNSYAPRPSHGISLGWQYKLCSTKPSSPNSAKLLAISPTGLPSQPIYTSMALFGTAICSCAVRFSIRGSVAVIREMSGVVHFSIVLLTGCHENHGHRETIGEIFPILVWGRPAICDSKGLYHYMRQAVPHEHAAPCFSHRREPKRQKLS